MRLTPLSDSSRRLRAVMRLSLATTTLPSLPWMSKRAISPRSRSGTNSSSAPLLPRWNVSNTKNSRRMCSLVSPIAFSSVVTGILRRRSTRKNRKSFGSNSKSSHEPRYGITRAENRSLPELCDDHALGPVDHERAVVGHELNLAHVDFLLLHFLHGVLGRFLVHQDQAH